MFVLNFVEIEVETSASQVDEERREQQEDVNMSEQRETSEREGEHGHANEEEQEQEDIVKFACDLTAAAVGEEERNGVRVQVEKMSEDKVAEEPSQAEDEEEMTVSTTRESPKKCGKASEVIELALKIMCGGGGEGGSTDKGGDCMDVDLDEGDEKEMEMKAVPMAVRVSCIQWAGGKRKRDGEEGGRKEDTLQRQPSPVPSTSAAFLATIKTSSLPTSPVFFKHEWANEDEEGMGDGQQDESFQEGINNISFVAGEVGPPLPPPPPPPIQTNVGPSSSQSQLQGSVSSLLTALQNPAGNTVLPCCCCVHPCCIVMSKPVVLILLIN